MVRANAAFPRWFSGAVNTSSPIASTPVFYPTPPTRTALHHPIVFMILWRGSAPCQPPAGSGTGTAQRHGRRRRRGGRGALFYLFPFLDFNVLER
jgi:hypothetical protein